MRILLSKRTIRIKQLVQLCDELGCELRFEVRDKEKVVVSEGAIKSSDMGD